jgi:hypothetical protein
MAARNVVLYTADTGALRKKSKPVRGMSRSVKHLVQDLKDTLAHSSDGIGLAAPQIAAHPRRAGPGDPVHRRRDRAHGTNAVPGVWLEVKDARGGARAEHL